MYDVTANSAEFPFYRNRGDIEWRIEDEGANKILIFLKNCLPLALFISIIFPRSLGKHTEYYQIIILSVCMYVKVESVTLKRVLWLATLYSQCTLNEELV